MGNGLKCPKIAKKKMVYPLLPKCSNFQITEFSPALEMDFESIFVSGGYNQGGRGLDHFASEPFINFVVFSNLHLFHQRKQVALIEVNMS